MISVVVRLAVISGLMLAGTLSSALAAPRFEVGIDAGKCVPSNSGYGDGDCFFIPFGLRFQSFETRLSIGHLGEFDYKSETSSDIRVDAVTLVAGPHLNVNRFLALDLFGGASVYRSRAQVADVDVGTNTDWCPVLGAGMRVVIRHNIELPLLGLLYTDISGARIGAVTFGFNFLAGRKRR